MDCKTFLAQWQHAAGEPGAPSADARVQLEGHLKACAACREVTENLGWTRELVLHASASEARRADLAEAVLRGAGHFAPVAARRSVMYWIAAAAVVLVGAGLVWGSGLWRHDAGQGDVATGAGSGAPIDARETLFVVDLAPEQKAVIAIDAATGKTRRHAVGSKLGESTVSAVESDAMTLEGGPLTGRRSVAEWNAHARSSMDAEVTALSVAFDGGGFRAGHFERLSGFAKFGSEGAIELLDRIASNGGELGKLAESSLAASGRLNTVRNLTRWAHEGTRQSRVTAIQSLGDLDSPLSLQCLLSLVEDEDENLALLAVDALARGGQGRAGLLARVAEQGGRDAVRNRAAALLEKLLKDADHEN